jgi:hypothetical protein
MRALDVLEKLSAPQMAHTRSVVSVPSWAMNWPAVQRDQPLQAVPELSS